jgi:hypothetical protein
MTVKKVGLCSTAVAALAAVLMFVTAEGTVESAALTKPLAEDTCLICLDDCGSETGWHYAFDDPFFPEEWFRNGGAHSSPDICRSGTCDTTHGPYGCTETNGEVITDETVERMRRALSEGDAHVAAGIIGRTPTRLKVNAERSAVQVLACQGSVVLHLPVSQRLLRSLVASTTGDD